MGMSWEEAKKKLPVGAPVHGVVKARFPFGVFLEVSDAPGAVIFMDLASYNPEGQEPPATPGNPLPGVGEEVHGLIAHHEEQGQQIRVRIGRPFWES